MSRDYKPKYHAIPTRFMGIEFRSKLEAKWFGMFHALGWQIPYEPLDLPGRIPDFVAPWAHPTIIECKPCVTLDEIREERALLALDARDWLLADHQRRLRELEADPNNGALDEVDHVLAEIARVERLEHPRRGRRAIVIGARIFDGGHDLAWVDDQHILARCARAGSGAGHWGLFEYATGRCLVCDSTGTLQHTPSADVLHLWLQSGNITQWHPRT